MTGEHDVCPHCDNVGCMRHCHANESGEHEMDGAEWAPRGKQ